MTSKRELTGARLAPAPIRRAHSTPDPEMPPSTPTPTPHAPPVPDDEPIPSHAPVEEPRLPEPPIRAD
jgi:hypothetical protein